MISNMPKPVSVYYRELLPRKKINKFGHLDPSQGLWKAETAKVLANYGNDCLFLLLRTNNC